METYAIDYGVGIADNTEIDLINILNATHLAMNRDISNLNITPKLIQVDGTSFKDYYNDSDLNGINTYNPSTPRFSPFTYGHDTASL